MSGLFQDIRFALRQLRKNLAFTSVIVVMLTLGIGATTVVFTFFHAILLRPLGFEKPEQLVQLWETRTEGSFQQMEFDWPDYVDIKAQQTVFSSLGGYSSTSATLLGEQGVAEQTRIGVASGDFFETLGVKPILGRTFRTSEDLQTKTLSVILPYGTWVHRYGANPNVIGQRLVLDGTPATVVGVLPSNFQFAATRSAEFWVSAHVEGWALRRNGHWFYPVGRLKPGVSLEQAQAAIQTLSRQLEQQFPTSNAGVSTKLIGLREQIVGPVQPILVFLMGAIGCVLLITCANVAGLLLARSVPRRKEMSIRLALGAWRVHIARQLLTESVLLALIGGCGGVLLAYWAVPAVVSLIPANALLELPAVQGLSLHIGMLWFALAVSLATGMGFGLAPVVQAFKADLRGEMQAGYGSVAVPHRRARNILVVSEVALAVVLLAAAGLMLRSLAQVMNVDPGFESANLLTAAVALPETKYHDGPKQFAAQQEMLRAVASLPGVKEAGAVTVVPLSGSGNTSRFDVEGHPKASGGEEYEANTRTVTQNYFSLMKIPLQAGRFFDSQDREKSEQVVVVNRAMADLVFPGQDPIGRRINFTYTNEPNLHRIVGVVANEHVDRVDLPPTPVIYTCFEQDPGAYFSVLARTDKDPLLLARSITRTLQGIEPEAPVYEVRSMAEIMAASPTMMLRAYPAYLIGGFAAVALVLALLGLYGVLAYGVAQRTREIGLRMALGAHRGDLLRLVLESGLKLTLVGTAIGIAAALGMGRLIAGLLFGVAPIDLPTFVTVCVLLLFAAVLASLIPAYRATRVDPMVALRCE